MAAPSCNSLNNPDWIPFDACTAASVGDAEALTAASEAMTLEQQCSPVQTPNSGGWTSLMYAAYYDHPDVATMLLQIAADLLTIKNKKQRSALMLAARYAHFHIVSQGLQGLHILPFLKIISGFFHHFFPPTPTNGFAGLFSLGKNT